MRKIWALALLILTGCDQASTVQEVPAVLENPIAAMVPLAETQTSLMFTIEGQLVAGSEPVAGLRLLVLPPQGEWTTAGQYDDFPVVYTATGPGEHAFKAVAFDQAGNSQDPERAPILRTIVPQPIIITDLTGEDFDITNAVLRYGMGLAACGHGLGRDRIVPIIDPQFIGPGEPGYPAPENLIDIMAVDIGGQQRAYAIGDLGNREVVDDVVAGVHLAATY